MALAVAEEEYLLAEAEISEFAPEADAVVRPDFAAVLEAAAVVKPDFASEAEIESISEIDLPAERELTPVYRLSVADLQSLP